jgi:hypothetical protein
MIATLRPSQVRRLWRGVHVVLAQPDWRLDLRGADALLRLCGRGQGRRLRAAEVCAS